jgi:hypothetical protein
MDTVPTPQPAAGEVVNDVNAPESHPAEVAPNVVEANAVEAMGDESSSNKAGAAPHSDAVADFESTYGRYRGHGYELTLPDTPALRRVDAGAASGIAADAGVAFYVASESAAGAQAAIEAVALGYQPPPNGSFEYDRGLSDLRREYGEGYREVVSRAQKYVAQRPALRALLDDPSRGALGNSAAVIRALATLAEGFGSTEAAQRFIAAVRNPESSLSKSYLAGDRETVYKFTFAHGVVAAAEKQEAAKKARRR